MKLFSFLLLAAALFLNGCGESKATADASPTTTESTAANKGEKSDPPAAAQSEAAPATPESADSKPTESTPAAEAEKPEAPAAADEAIANIDHPGFDLHEEHCARCHEPDFYKPSERVAKHADIGKMVRACDAQLGTALFDEDMDEIIGFLNESYYKFPIE